MKNLHFLLIIFLSIFIAAAIHYFESQSLQPKSDNFCPNNIPCFNDYEKGLKAAQKWRKPIAVLFTGWAVGARTLEERIFGEETIQQLLTEDYLLITLFVDDRTSLPQSEQFDYFHQEKQRITRTGEKWQYFQISCFNNNTQPIFALLNPYEESLQKKPMGFVKPEELNIYLQEGLHNFQKGISAGKMECDFNKKLRPIDYISPINQTTGK